MGQHVRDSIVVKSAGCAFLWCVTEMLQIDVTELLQTLQRCYRSTQQLEIVLESHNECLAITY